VIADEVGVKASSRGVNRLRAKHIKCTRLPLRRALRTTISENFQAFEGIAFYPPWNGWLQVHD
jgi:hypothetical protein